MAEDIDDIASRLGSAEKRVAMNIDGLAGLWKAFMESEKDLRADVAALKKQIGDPKEIADLKARVKELETKLGKMKK